MSNNACFYGLCKTDTWIMFPCLVSLILSDPAFSSCVSCGPSVGRWHLRRHVLQFRPLSALAWTIATLFWSVLPRNSSLPSPVSTECGSSSGFRRWTSRPHHVGSGDTALASSPSASCVQDGSSCVEVPKRWSAALPVSRLHPLMVVVSRGLRCLDLFWYRGPGLPLASAGVSGISRNNSVR